MTSENIHKHDVVIIGGGLAGLRAAIEAMECRGSDGFCPDVALLSKVHPLRSHSVAAQGGINAALGNAPGASDDRWEDHAFDTVKGSDYLADQDTVDVLCGDAPGAVIEMEHMGTVFSRFEDGRIAQRPFGGAGFPRTCYAADRTGHNLLHSLYEQALDRGIRIYEEYFVTSLAVSEIGEGKRRCVGCVALDLSDGTLHGFSAGAMLLATGGYGRIFERSTNAPINTGDGAALALRAGVPLKDMEFVQFHPTSLYGTNILITEGARGEGGYLFNNLHERFMEKYAPKAMELAPRDIVARAIQTEVNEGRGFENEYVHLDLTHLGAERIMERLPGIRQIAMDFAGIDPIEKPIPVQPGQHYSMGGVACDVNGATPLPGLYAVGECACVSVHGANRLGGNSLLETVVFGKRTGRTIAEFVKGLKELDGSEKQELLRALERDRSRIDALMARESGMGMADIRGRMKNIMFRDFGVFRHESAMKSGLEELLAVKEKLDGIYFDNRNPVFNLALQSALELEGMILVAEAIARGSLAREESRGSHFRTDFSERDDERFLAHTMAQLRHGNSMELKYAPVTLGRFPVKERVY